MPLANAVPDEADVPMRRAYALLPHVKITELLLEVEEWTRFTPTQLASPTMYSLALHLLGYPFAPRIRDLTDRRLYVPDCRKDYPVPVNSAERK